MAKLALQGSNTFAYSFRSQTVTTSGSFVKIDDTPTLNLGGGNFTIECWLKPDGIYSIYNDFFSKSASGSNASYLGALGVTTGLVAFWSSSSNTYSSTRLTSNTWSHVAYVFNNGANVQIYVNGTLVAVNTSLTAISNLSGDLYIGSSKGVNEGYSGEISNFRIIKGQAIYTGNFVISSTPFNLPNNAIGLSGTNVAASLTGNVIVLSCNDQKIQSNGNTLLNVTYSGDVYPHAIDTKELQNFSYYYPGNTGSGQNGTVLVTSTTNSLNLNGDFTIETWYYPTSNTGVVLERGLGGVGGNNASYIIVWDGQNNQLNFASSNANGNTYSVGSLTGATGNIGNPTINAWNHIAVSHTGTTYRGFLNGNLNLTITNNANVPYAALGRGVTIGGMFDAGLTYATGIPSNTISGYISNMRIIRGNSIYNAAFTPSNTSQLSNVTNTILLTGLTPAFEDLSGVHTLSTNGQSQINISTLSPILASSVINTNAANVSFISSTRGVAQGRIYGKFDYSSFGLQSSIPPVSGVRQGRIYDKIDYVNFGMQVDIFSATGAKQTKIYDRFDTLNFAYIPTGGSSVAPNYQFWS